MVEKTRSVARRIHDLVPVGDGQRGQSLIIVAFLIIALLAAVGLAVDLGLMYVEKVRLGRAVDAAALAGAQELPGPFENGCFDLSLAYDRMEEYLRLNGYVENAEGFDLAAAFPAEPECADPDSCSCARYHLVVSATQSVGLTFLRVLNFDTVDVSAHAIGENANRLDVAIVLDVSGSMANDTCTPPGPTSVGHGCSPWWGSSTDIFFEDFSTYNTGTGATDPARLCGGNSPWDCDRADLVGAYDNSYNMSGGGKHAQTAGSSSDDGRFYRYLDASPYDQIEVAFYEKTYGCSGDDRIRGWYAPAGPWLSLMELACNSTQRQRVYSRDSQAAASFGLRFGGSNLDSTSDVTVFDNIRVRGVTAGKGPYSEVSCTSGSQNCTCPNWSSSYALQCGYTDLAGRYKVQPLWDTLNAADWFITQCKLGPDPDDPPCLDPDLDQVGLAYYSDDGDYDNYYPASGDSTTAMELSSDYSAITNTLWTAFSAAGFTNIGDGLYRGCEILSTNEAEGHHGRTNAVHILILLSDGRPNRPCNPATMNCMTDQTNSLALQNIDNAVDWAVQNGIVVFTISLGSWTDPSVMIDIAETTGGIHQKAETTDDLQAVFQEIAQHIYLRLTG